MRKRDEDLRSMLAARRRHTRVFAVTSGKGGVGKTHIAANLAVVWSQAGFRVIAVDLDLGVGNLDLLMGIEAPYNLSHVINGGTFRAAHCVAEDPTRAEGPPLSDSATGSGAPCVGEKFFSNLFSHALAVKSIKEVMVSGPAGVLVVPGANGFEHIANLDLKERQHLMQSLMELDGLADILILDTGAGIHENVMKFCRMADDIVVVAMAEPTSVAAAYSTIKLITAHPKHGRVHLLVNKGDDERSSMKVAEGLAAICKQYLELDLNLLGWVKDDNVVVESMKTQIPYTLFDEKADASRCLRRAVQNIFPPVVKAGGQAGTDAPGASPSAG
ncbi:MAG: P-loop NTPase [Planctomycetes bacterium]|nr:P-loop NTPase [Planctomycetota bacterium]